MKNAHPFYSVCQVLKVLLIKIFKIQPPSSFISCCYTLVFTSADIISTTFQNFIQHYLKKKFKDQNLLSKTIITLISSLNYIVVSHLYLSAILLCISISFDYKKKIKNLTSFGYIFFLITKKYVQLIFLCFIKHNK